MNDTKKKIEDTDLTIDRLENLAKLVIDRWNSVSRSAGDYRRRCWDMECILYYAQLALFQHYQYDIDRAVEDAEDYTLEELDNE